jgi:hypothetical protein
MNNTRSRKHLYVLICMVVLLLLPFYVGADGESQCVSCHTSGRSLVTATREIALELGDQILKSTESEGEG